MIYGLYLSAQGVLANSYRQDVIANNLANAETVGFKRDLTRFTQQRTAAQQRGLSPNQHSNSLLEALGGGLGVAPSFTDTSQGEAEVTGRPLDIAIQGQGYFPVQSNGETRLTRDGRFTIDRQGYLALAGGGQRILDEKLKPIKLDSTQKVIISEDGKLTQNGQPIARLGLLDAPDSSKLSKQGDLLMSYPDIKKLKPAAGSLQSGYVERSNVEPANELVALMETQRQLEANANMIRFQDQMLSRLVNDVGKIG
jgi:flagellar basal-body rod protein FlgF